MIGCLSTQALAFLAVFSYATQAIAFERKPGFTRVRPTPVLRFDDECLFCSTAKTVAVPAAIVNKLPFFIRNIGGLITVI